MFAELVVLTYNIPVSGSNAPPPQFAPPMIPGRITVPWRLGGVKMGPIRYFFSSACASAFSSGVKSKASSSETPSGESGGGRVGKGCLMEAISPGTSLAGKPRPSPGPTGLPRTRPEQQNKPHHVPHPTAPAFHPPPPTPPHTPPPPHPY